MTGKGTQQFKNMTKLPNGSWQLKFKKNGKETQPTYKSLEGALQMRNHMYLMTNYRPYHLFILMMDETIVGQTERTQRSGNVYTHYNIHCRNLTDRSYAPCSKSDYTEAMALATAHIRAHNAIAAVYNGYREKAFLIQITNELTFKTPLIETGFDLELWRKSAREVFPDGVPKYFEDVPL